MIGLLGLVLIKLGSDRFLAKRFNIAIPRPDSQLSSLEYSPFYHLAIVILVLAEIDWNLFDLVIWAYAYVGVGIIRRALLSIKLEKEALLNGYSFDLKIIRLL
jgi:hypothetical protein